VKVAVAPLAFTEHAIFNPPPVRINAFGVNDAVSIVSLNVTVIGMRTDTPVPLESGTVEITVGGAVSGAISVENASVCRSNSADTCDRTVNESRSTDTKVARGSPGNVPNPQ